MKKSEITNIKQEFNKHSTDIKVAAILTGAALLDIGLVCSGLPASVVGSGMTVAGLTAAYFVADTLEKAEAKAVKVKVENNSPKM